MEDIKPQLLALKKTSTGRQITAIDRLISAVSPPGQSSGGSVSGSVTSATPASPSLQVDVNSAAPTPVLTMEPNTPQSNSPPSTSSDTVEELVHADGKMATPSDAVVAAACPEVRLDEA